MSRARNRQPPDDALGRTRRSIRVLADQRVAAKADAAAALVTHAEVGRALAEQGRRLAVAHGQIGAAMADARRAADDIRAEDGVGAAGPYEQAEAGLRAQLDVVDAARRQLDELTEASSGHLEQARALLRRSVASLDDALREQVALLTRLERLERDQVIAQARARRSQPPGPGWQVGHQ